MRHLDRMQSRHGCSPNAYSGTMKSSKTFPFAATVAGCLLVLVLPACSGVRWASVDELKEGTFETLKQIRLQDCNKIVSPKELGDCKRQAASATYDSYQSERDKVLPPDAADPTR